ncbi:alpha-1,2-fucosyltransferase [Polynucleobacter paneuropaeus]|nr:alpha-1,2-fucosyltransferase [Polynucleobacter paneuropaeus]
MIIVKINGGLGNQMFQYAACKALADLKSTSFKVDITKLNDENNHNGYELERVFQISNSIAKSHEVKSILGVWRNNPLYKIRKKLNFLFSGRLYIEKSIDFDASFYDLCDNTYLDGYFQSQNYFLKSLCSIRNNFKFRDGLDQENEEIANLIKIENSVSVHVRRGDYEGNNFYANCTNEYYLSAMEFISSKTRNPLFFIFSDDIKWAENNFRHRKDLKFVKNNCGLKSFNDMHLMSLCRHHINANSSFSWWASFLSEFDRGITIAPKNWFRDKLLPHTIHMPNWILL